MNYHTQNGRTRKRGAFINGVWHCDCEPPIPADKFQTKNGGKNHGRWFYTCQKPQPKRCGFFLWSDDAKVREESAVLNNSRSEPGIEPQTPKKPTSIPEAPLTPQSRKSLGTKQTPIKFTSAPAGKSDSSIATIDHEDSYEWPSSDDVDWAEAAAQATVLPPPFETPRKTPRTDHFPSPGKRTHSEMQGSQASSWLLSTPSNDDDDDDVFATPTTTNRSDGLPSPTPTPAQALSKMDKGQPCATSDSNSTLAVDALKILAPVPLTSAVESELVILLNTHALRAQGIAKGRDITRLAIQAKDKKIAELQARIAGLEAERETSRTVIAHLKQDIGAKASSPKKGISQWKYASRRTSPSKT